MSQNENQYSNEAEEREAIDDIPAHENTSNNIGDILNRRYGRRSVLGGMVGAIAAGSNLGWSKNLFAQSIGAQPSFNFKELKGGVDANHHVAEGHEAKILIRWGDPIFVDAPKFDPHNQTANAQLQQFGYNNDYIGFLPLDDSTNGPNERGLLCVNHEYTNEEVMFPNMPRQERRDFAEMTDELIDIEMAAHGGTIIEIAFKNGKWMPVLTSPYNRRITPLATPMELDGPAAGHDRMKTSDDPTGRHVIGTLNNCAGGMTPWGTYLMAEENFHFYFWTEGLSPKIFKDEKPANGFGGGQEKSNRRYKLGTKKRLAWGKYHKRFNLDHEPNAANRFGWVVEVDPMNRKSRPVKHTALGRFCHEGAECILSKDGHAVIYMGDDTRFEYLYRFVSKGRYVAGERLGNMKLLAEGTLSVAVFHDDGTLKWRALEFGHGPLTQENGFYSQADVLIDARLAGEALGATPMDRPEDVQPNAQTGKVYVMLTNNRKRLMPNAANPRVANFAGHIIEFTPDGLDHAAATARWELLIQCGKPGTPLIGGKWHSGTSADGWFAAPDDAAVDNSGRLWIATDQGGGWRYTGKADGLYALETAPPLRGLSKLFFRVPIGGECCGPQFTPDGETLFVAVQHPGTDGTKHYPGFNRISTFADPATRWPDFEPNTPPRPAVLAIRRTGGGKIA